MIALHLKKLPLTREVSLLILAYLYVPIFVPVSYTHLTLPTIYSV